VSLLWHGYHALAPVLGALAPYAGALLGDAERALYPERLGRVVVPGGSHAWVHAASLGETLGVAPLVRALRDRHPAARIWCTSTTRTGRERLGQAGLPVSLAPLDTPQAVRRFLAGVRPSCVLLLETELWPHWLGAARRDGVPVAVVSARLSPRSVARYARLGAPLRAAVAGLAAVLAQGEGDAERFLALGARAAAVEVTGNLKDDGLPAAAADRTAARRAMGMDGARPLLVLGSLRPGEALRLARGWRSLPEGVRTHWQVVAVPRHPAARAGLQEEVVAAGVADGPGSWHWEDRTGVLAGWYSAADAAFVGGSLEPFGGHNPLEPAACAAAVVMGPYDAHQRDAVARLERAGALERLDPEAVGAGLLRVLGDPRHRQALAEAARGVAAAARGAAARTVAALVRRGLWESA
jgi:3-deoxy-D-manno-octulosonic-acid transferase